MNIIAQIKSVADQFDKKTMRRGQALMNALFTVDKNLYVKIIETEFDPFYDDKKIESFFNYLKNEQN